MSNVFPDAELILLSNGPGELATWVRPVLEELQQSQPRLYSGLRVSILLSPCVHAGGYELHIAQNFAGVDRVLGPDQFFSFLLWGNTADRWQWRQQGVVVFLGGDQFYSVAIGKRLGYRIVTYAEWSVRWLPWIDRCGVARSEVCAKVPRRYHSKLTVVGNLITDIRASAQPTSCLSDLGWDTETEIVGLLPGSKPMKLQVGVPFCLAIADHLHRQRPQTRFIIPVAPGLTLKTLAAYANPAQNPLIIKGAGSSATLVQSPQGIPYLQTPQGCQIKLWTPYPAYDLLANCQICVTTVGANTAELTALAVPMLVVIPTQHLDLMRAWDGLWGLMANLPILGTPFATLINGLILQQGLGLRAWPNIWAQQEIVPELVGKVSGQAIADRLQTLLETPTDLQQMHQALQTLRGHTGSVQRLVKLIVDVLPSGT
ncbi:MAG: lipid-A-disaccharide synthase [Acaryochloridaceae cyanobacterium CSU_3_4]|nr:lipid-A-disaccharide synthase [Acaryochloridaceae cyanobacterium CSU_3_4]